MAKTFDPIVVFDTEAGELTIEFGKDSITFDKFLKSSDGKCFQMVIPKRGQTLLLKKLVANIEE